MTDVQVLLQYIETGDNMMIALSSQRLKIVKSVLFNSDKADYRLTIFICRD